MFFFLLLFFSSLFFLGQFLLRRKVVGTFNLPLPKVSTILTEILTVFHIYRIRKILSYISRVHSHVSRSWTHVSGIWSPVKRIWSGVLEALLDTTWFIHFKKFWYWIFSKISILKKEAFQKKFEFFLSRKINCLSFLCLIWEKKFLPRIAIMVGKMAPKCHLED